VAASIVYCAEPDGALCLEVYEDGELIVDQILDYPYLGVPTDGLKTYIAEFGSVINNHISYFSTSSEDEWQSLVSDLYNKIVNYNRVKGIAQSRPDYAP
jgi:hypothetical protein